MPRPTLDLDAKVLRDLKRLKRTNGRSIGQIASELLAAALRAHREPATQEPGFEWRSAGMRARVDLDDKEALVRALEGR